MQYVTQRRRTLNTVRVQNMNYTHQLKLKVIEEALLVYTQ